MNVNVETEIVARDCWYDRGDYIFLLADEGTKNKSDLRAAQLRVIAEEISAMLMICEGKDETGHTYEVGPYQWTVNIYDESDIGSRMEFYGAEVNSEFEDLVIATCGGGDSLSFGYNWCWNRVENVVYMTEDPANSRVPVQK